MAVPAAGASRLERVLIVTCALSYCVRSVTASASRLVMRVSRVANWVSASVRRPMITLPASVCSPRRTPTSS